MTWVISIEKFIFWLINIAKITPNKKEREKVNKTTDNFLKKLQSRLNISINLY